jgi:hypothetical protein
VGFARPSVAPKACPSVVLETALLSTPDRALRSPRNVASTVMTVGPRSAPRPADDQIRAARLAIVSPEVSVLCPRPGHDPIPGKEKPRISGAFSEPTPGIEPGTPSLRES